jgi:hypothetical protein
MGFYNNTDIKVTPSGDLNLAGTGDFEMIQSSGVLQQDVTFRLRTNYAEFEPHPNVGADLDELIGEPNVKGTSKAGEAKINHSLTFDNMVDKADLYIRGVPVSTEKIVYYVFVNNGTEQLNVTPDVVFDMMEGMVNIPGE